ncbi:MAG: protein kinase [Gemmatimonadales bacterium]|nr:protein kinase [Gemmatimonadales bacterium]
MSDGTRCFGCGAAVPETSRFCGNCGRQLTDPQAATLVDETAALESLLDRLRRVMAGEYRVERELARGGMGVVFQATEEHAGRTVALKILSPELGITARAAERFKREARMVAELEHPNIVPVYRVGHLGGMLFITMKYIAGRSLDEITAAQGALPIAAVLLVLRGAARSLAYAHEHDIVHRDVKAANILIERDGRVLVTDFGVALRASDVTLTQDGAVIGTPGYMSPEQCAGKRATPQSDQYSLGVVAFQMLTGTLPYKADSLPGIMHHHFFTPLPSLRFVRDDVPPAMIDIVERLMAKGPRDRYATTRELVNDLDVLPFSAQERHEAERLLGRLTAGDAMARVATRELPKLPDAPTLRFDAMPRPRNTRRRGGRRWAAVAAGLAVIAVGSWAAFTPRPVVSAASDSAVALSDSAAPSPPPPAAPAATQRAQFAGASRAASTPTGKLRLLTAPGDAAIYIDGQRRGVGAVLDLPVAAGRRRLEVRALGYHPFDTVLTIIADSTVSLGRITLREQPAGP